MDIRNSRSTEYREEEFPEGINTTKLELYFLTRKQNRIFNLITISLVSIYLFISIVAHMLSDGSETDIFPVWMSFVAAAMLTISYRIWWVWWSLPQDNLFWFGFRIRLSTAMMGFALFLAGGSSMMIKKSTAKDSLILDIFYIAPILTIGLVINIVNVIRLLRLWYIWRKILRTAEQQRRADENAFITLFRSREGYSEARQEIEAAGIGPGELDEIQRMEWRNARQLLSNFGSRALQNINLLRIIMNIDGDRNPDDTDENRVLLFTRIKSLIFEKEKHGDVDSWSICWNDFHDKEQVKILPKWAHIFSWRLNRKVDTQSKTKQH